MVHWLILVTTTHTESTQTSTASQGENGTTTHVGTMISATPLLIGQSLKIPS
jgi:hypothetical protein